MYFRARYYSPQLGQFISRDPLGYVDGMSQYRAYFVPGGTDPTGSKKLLDIKITKVKVIPGKCQEDANTLNSYEGYYKFTLSEPAPCAGYFVKYNRTIGESKPCLKCLGGKNPYKIGRGREFEFWEAWFVDKGETTFDLNVGGSTDGVTRTFTRGTCGHHTHFGVVKFFCEDDLKKDRGIWSGTNVKGVGYLGVLGKNGGTRENPWKIKQVYANKFRISGTPGLLPSTADPASVAWWNDSNYQISNSASFQDRASWICCNNRCGPDYIDRYSIPNKLER